ncbi:MAG TPA: phospholipid carrier-dependent glycosyltransferase [Patescibacteria group bacterium]|nr:phospholipid carrier-dependent glycosyltransferase [Patescibacteria group bacterium]
MIRIRRARLVFLALPIILLFFFLALDSMVGDSPTMDEQNHLARGIALMRSGDPRFSLEHPPLINLLSALPLLTIDDLQIPFDHPSWDQPEGWYAFADQLLWVYNHDVTRMIFLARLPSIFLTLALALICFHFARELWGKPAALIAFLLVLFDPNILAHGRYITTDLGGTTMLVLAAYLLWRLWKTAGWHWGRLLAATVGLGLALSSKLSILVFLPIFALISLLPLYEGNNGWRDSLRRLASLAIASLGALIIVWAIYAFEWGSFRFSSNGLESLNHLSGPMPTFFGGIEQILLISGGGRPSFLLGQFSTEGWWYYFPIAFLVKTPLPVLGLFGLAVVLMLKERLTRGRAVFLILPAVLFFLVSMGSSLNIGYRHLLPILPFLYLLGSGMTALPAVTARLPLWEARLVKGMLIAVVASVLIIDIILHPHYLSYFNILGGGPSNGHQILVDSNLDWGQDLLRLKKWMAHNEIEKVKLSWFGTADPGYYDIDYEPLPGLTHHFDLWWDVPFDSETPEPGIYAISVSNLWEIPLEEKNVFPWFRDRPPDDRIGYSIHIYMVTEEKSDSR